MWSKSPIVQLQAGIGNRTLPPPPSNISVMFNSSITHGGIGSSYFGPAAPMVPEPTLIDIGNNDQQPQIQLQPQPQKFQISAQPPLPPLWDQSVQEALTKDPLAPYYKIPLDPATKEYQILSTLIQPQTLNINLQTIERVINPQLMKKFLNHRKEMITAKSRNLELLSQLGIPGNEITHQATLNLNWNVTKEMDEFEYSDNVVLLFHCTKSRKNVELILEEGLDDRLGSKTFSSLLGRGIYFTDDPKKALSYDSSSGSTLFIFAVYLGDCLGLWTRAQLHASQEYTREPYKRKGEKRNFHDKFFDSIVGRPNTANEFVISNRSACVPLYVVTYSKFMFPAPTPWIKDFNLTTNLIEDARSSLPPFAWPNDGNCPKQTKRQEQETYPFYAQSIFNWMLERDGLELDEGEEDLVLEDEEKRLQNSVRLLSDLGFKDEPRNSILIKKYSYSISKVINELVENGDPLPPTVISPPVQSVKRNSFSNPRGQASAGPTRIPIVSPDDSSNSSCLSSLPDDFSDILLLNQDVAMDGSFSSPNTVLSKEDCAICAEDYPVDCVSSWKKLPSCTHKLCATCYNRLLTTGTTMSTNVQHSFIKCPFCQICSGTQIGTCPNGTMTISNSSDNSWIKIVYQITSPSHSIHRKAYLPNSPDGIKILALLQLAWERRLIFSIGTSITSGRSNSLIWNVHHKTSKSGGTSNYGYPDPTYFQRVQDELKQFGIE